MQKYLDKICIFTFSYSANRQSMLDYIEKIMPDNIKLFFFTTKKFKSFYKTRKIKIVDTECNRLNAMFELRKFCNVNKVKRVISLGLIYESIPMIYTSAFSKTSYVIYQLGNPVEGIIANKGLTKIRSIIELLSYYFLILVSEKTIFCSKEITDFFKKYFFQKRKIFFLPTTIPTELFNQISYKEKLKLRKNLGFKSTDKILIFVGRIGYLKGLDIFINAVKNNQYKKFLLIGNLVDSTFKEKNLPNMIIISPKSQEELVKYYNIADLCFFPSRLEGVALVPREAMSCGTPALMLDIISTKAIKKAIKTPADYDSVNKAIRDFFSLSKESRKKISKDSRQYIVEEYDDKVWKSLYTKLLFD